MRAFQALGRLIAVGVPVALLAGCDLLTESKDSNPPPATDWESTLDLESAYGGHVFSDEAASFGDPQVLKVEQAETAQAAIAEPDTIRDDSTYVVRILWGRLQADSTAQIATDWSGSVGVSRGRLAVLRTIAFEPPTDHLVRPRSNPQSVSFISHTRPSFDGLLLLVHDVPATAADPAATTFGFETGPYTHTWTLAELVGAHLVIRVDDQGNSFSIDALPAHQRDCPRGFVRGAWVTREADRGVLYGVWLAAHGPTFGAMRGHFGVNRTGERVWFAKVIGPGGSLIGLARGHWEPNVDPSQPGGTFVGGIETRLGGPGGTIVGKYLPGRMGPRGAAGFLEARWHLDCEGGPAVAR